MVVRRPGPATAARTDSEQARISGLEIPAASNYHTIILMWPAVRRPVGSSEDAAFPSEALSSLFVMVAEK